MQKGCDAGLKEELANSLQSDRIAYCLSRTPPYAGIGGGGGGGLGFMFDL